MENRLRAVFLFAIFFGFCSGVEGGCRVSPLRASNFSLAREKSPKARLNTCGKTLFAPEALRSDSLPQVSLEEV
ncbi:hypothetical protein G7048_04975 [Diaphorobacter sp. HDW4B]|uniref:hypothetical protein n=1 Tax=Diaphorobacter sp. HDW4B TaxID=2714925 RepID=UPI001407932B|nr:hypothetical protein [Diaphorobacter sp. HDW4B]QIL69773.1 hypothetical protein G7048_04975 [Diaphorobacter sp. HDW4B]